jgi:hypothetical protein
MLFMAAANACRTGDRRRPTGQPVSGAGADPQVSAQIGVAVAENAYASGLAGKPKPQDVMADVREQMYDPRYESYVQRAADATS